MVFFFVKQKAAYEMRISDWSSDVCSSDLKAEHRLALARARFADDAEAAARLDLKADALDGLQRAARSAKGDPEVVDIEQGHDPSAPADRAHSAGRRRPHRSEERRVGKECVRRVDLGGRSIIKKKKDRCTDTEKETENKT